MIELSASSVKDFIACPAKAWFRSVSVEENVQDESQALGSAIHKIVEVAPFAEDRQVTDKIITKYRVTDFKKVKRCLSNFYYSYSPLLTKEDLVEARFEFTLNGIHIRGIMDRIILQDDVVIDWKTGEKCPESIDNDIQFMLYYLAYKDIYKREPKVYYVSLAKNKRVQFNPNENLISVLTGEILPSIVEAIQRKWYPRMGIYKNICQFCNYRKECLK